MVELVRIDKTVEAVDHLKKYLMPQYLEHKNEVNKVTALLAVGPVERCRQYRVDSSGTPLVARLNVHSRYILTIAGIISFSFSPPHTMSYIPFPHSLFSTLACLLALLY